MARIVSERRSAKARWAVLRRPHGGEDRLLGLGRGADDVALPAVIGGQDAPSARPLGCLCQASVSVRALLLRAIPVVGGLAHGAPDRAHLVRSARQPMRRASVLARASAHSGPRAPV